MTKFRHKMKLVTRVWMLCIFFAVVFNCFTGVNGQSACDAGKFGHECALECHCVSGTTCKSDGSCDKCDALWGGPTCQLELENIALNKGTVQWPDTKKSKESKLAVDGDLTTSSWVQNRDENGTVYWYVDLEKESSIYKIILHFNDPEPKDDDVEKRRPGWSLMSSNSKATNKTEGIPCYEDNSKVPADPMVTLSNCTSPARYISVYNSRVGQPSRSWSRLPNIELSEVQVLSSKDCSVGTYGDQCEHECGHCEDKSCDRIDGTCPTSCALGYYGDSCNKTCPSNCKDKTCEKLDGKCLGDCEVGFYGDSCNMTCPSNCKDNKCEKSDGTCLDCEVDFYGDYCNQSCSSHCNDPGCRRDGNCDGECEAGFAGNSCNKTCPKNCAESKCLKTGECISCKDKKHHSLHCNVSCGSNCKDGCDQSNADCLGGCNGKFYGDKCELPCLNCKTGCYPMTGICTDEGCETNYYGDSCENKCASECVVGEGCERASGKCGLCDDTKYGDQCKIECNANCIDKKCHRNGTCIDGCQDKHFHGYMCDKNCSKGIDNCMQCEMISGTVSCMKCTNAKYGEQCDSNCPTNCEQCKSLNECSHCKVGFSGITCTDECEVDNCKRCNTSGKCQTCEDGYFGENCEHLCKEHCQTCVAKTTFSNESNCRKCKKGQFLFRNGCIECIDKCTACSFFTNCTECAPGSHGTTCSKYCPKNCQECTSEDTCTKCDDGWSGKKCQCSHNCYREGDLDSWCYENGTCAKGCIDGKMGDNCDSDCAGKGHCLDCNQKSGKCEKCVSGLYGGLDHCDKECGKCLPDTSGEVKCAIRDGKCIGPCEDGYFGEKCTQNCSENCLDPASDTHKCEKSGGKCAGCKPGYYGNKCEQKCNENCLDPKTNTNTCDKITGVCSACKGGYFGDKCSENCSYNCEASPGVNTCDKKTGKCQRCKQKFYGDFCDKQCGKHCESDCDQTTGICDACKSNHYDSYCNLTCPQNCGVEPFSTSQKIVCQRTSGECLHCKFGYYGELCDESCPEYCARSVLTGNKPECYKAGGSCRKCQIGYFGDTCKKGCNRNCEKEGNNKNGSCDQQSGHCDIGCMPGWYNSTCEKTCNSSCKVHTCHRQTAECLIGCEDGYEGVFCEKRKEEKSALWIIVIVILIIVVAIVLIVGIIMRRRYRRKKADSGKVAKNGTRLNKLGRPEEINPLLNGNTALVMPSRGMPDDDVIEEDETDVPLRSDPSEYYNSSTQIPVSGFTEYLQNRKRDNADWYKQDFSKLPKGLLKSCDVATRFGNRGKCRYKQLYPYDVTRVKLEPEGEEKSDFINASYINGYKKPEAFIAAQGPTDNTVNDFWRMIFQKDCGKIVMLTNLFEECKMKCVRYWPEADEPQTYGIYEVTMVSENELPNYTVRHLQATHGETKEVKDFQHLHFTAWPDRGVPDNPSVMLHFRDKVMSETTHLDGPILVHCSAGIGRTGTFVALDYLLKQAHVEPHIDVFRTVCDMRYQRTNFVQTDIQYEFVHNAISEALNTKESEVSEAEFSQHYWSMLETCQGSDITKLQDQFEMINQMSPIPDESSFSVGKSEENINKNRDPDILPLDINRAYLSTPVKGSNEYVNAVFLPTCSNKTGFLITQMPLPHTVTDFWRLVYDQHVSNIVMMNNIDDDDETIGEYWPSDDSTYGPFRVELISCDNNMDFSCMTIQLTHSSLSRQTTMKVRLFRFEGWSDGATLPSTTTSLTSLISQVSRSSRDSKSEPIIVHCMNGAKRSGLYCAVSSILERLQMEKKINIPQIILQLRARRPQLINTFEQFDFCYRAVLDYLENTQIYSNVL